MYLGQTNLKKKAGAAELRVGHVENIRVTFKCKNCDYEWTDIEQKNILSFWNLLPKFVSFELKFF